MLYLPHSASLFGIVFAELRAAALLAHQRRARDRLGDIQHVRQIHRRVPAVVVLTVIRNSRRRLAFVRASQSTLSASCISLLGTHDADEVLHELLQLVLDLIRILAGRADFERLRARLRSRHPPVRRRLPRRAFSFANSAANWPARLPNTSRSDKRVAAEPVGAVQSRRGFAGRVQARHRGRLRIAIDANAAHHVVRGRTDFHRHLRDVDLGELLELVIHARQLALDVLGSVRDAFLDPSDVEKHAAVRTAPACLHFTVDAAGDVIACQELGWTARVLIALRVSPAFFF